MVTQETQGCEDLSSEAPNQRSREAGEIVGLDQLVQVDAEQFGDDAEMTSERERIVHPNDVVRLVRVL